MTVADRPLAVVTGASRGLGRTLAGLLAGEGYDLVLTGRDAPALTGAGDALRATGVSIQTLAGDVSDERHRRALAHGVAARGRLELLVNNASELGPSPLPSLAQVELPELRRLLEVNLIAPLALTQLLLPALVAARGRVVNISSDAAVEGYPGWGAYGTSKAGLDLLTRTWAKELKDQGVSFVSVDPGDMRTAMHQAAFPGEDISDRPPPEVTLPFWAWFLAQSNAAVSGRRFRAQAERWEVPA
jgi:NAD(P)-dependent dehydrogenase (short-subunit alcohol dehydrogenase family)